VRRDARVVGEIEIRPYNTGTPIENEKLSLVIEVFFESLCHRGLDLVIRGLRPASNVGIIRSQRII